jgi:hypothetical protein
MSITKEQLRELAAAGVDSISITIDDPVAYAESLAPDVDFGLSPLKETVSIATVDGVPAVSRTRSGMGWLRREGKRSLTIYITSPAKMSPLPQVEAA